jgi:hypothetical protein
MFVYKEVNGYLMPKLLHFRNIAQFFVNNLKKIPIFVLGKIFKKQ